MTLEEVKVFNKTYKIDGYPGTMRKVRSVFDDMPLDTINDYRTFWKAEFAKRYGKGDNPSGRFLSRSLSLMEKYVKERTKSVDESRNRLVQNLTELLTPFKQLYMDAVRNHAIRQYQWAYERRSWNKLDWIAASFVNTKKSYGYQPCVLVPYLAANGKTIWLGLCGRYKQIYQLDEIDPTESHTYFGAQITVKAEDLKEARICNSELFEIPACKTKSKSEVLFIYIKENAGFEADGEQKWIARQREEAEQKFNADICVLADKIRLKSINEDKMSLEYASNDPKHIEICINDGTTALHARSILAAENSVLVTPHFRFIVTEKVAR